MSGAEAGSSTPVKQPLLPEGGGDNAPDKNVVSQLPRLSPKDVLLGGINLSFIFMPIVLFAKNVRGQGAMRFKHPHEFTPVLLNIILGIQNACVALGQIVAPPLLFHSVFSMFFDQYFLQSAIIIAGISSLLQCLNIKIPGTPYRIGTGLSAFLGNSLLMGHLILRLMTRDAIRHKGNFKDAYGDILGTAALCSLFFIVLAFIPRKYIKPAFPPLVCGIIITLIGIDAVQTSTEYWGGGIDCLTTERLCQMNGNVHLPYGSAEYIGLGFLALVLFMIFELVGTGIQRRGIILFSTLITYVVAAIVKHEGHRYVSGDKIDESPKISFLWTSTYDIGFDKHAVIPLLTGFIAMYIQATAILTASLEESQLDIESEEESERIQGGLIVSGFMSFIATLATGMPVMPVPQNNTVIYATGIASNIAGIAGSLFLIFFGIFGKVMAFFFMEIPLCVRGAIFTLLSAGIVLTGVKILSRQNWNRRGVMIMFLSLLFGLAHILEPNFFSEIMWDDPSADNDFAQSIRIAVFTLLRTPYFTGGTVAIILHLLLPADMELGVVESLPETSGA